MTHFILKTIELLYRLLNYKTIINLL